MPENGSCRITSKGIGHAYFGGPEGEWFKISCSDEKLANEVIGDINSLISQNDSCFDILKKDNDVFVTAVVPSLEDIKNTIRHKKYWDDHIRL